MVRKAGLFCNYTWTGCKSGASKCAMGHNAMMESHSMSLLQSEHADMSSSPLIKVACETVL